MQAAHQDCRTTLRLKRERRDPCDLAEVGIDCPLGCGGGSEPTVRRGPPLARCLVEAVHGLPVAPWKWRTPRCRGTAGSLPHRVVDLAERRYGLLELPVSDVPRLRRSLSSAYASSMGTLRIVMVFTMCSCDSTLAELMQSSMSRQQSGFRRAVRGEGSTHRPRMRCSPEGAWSCWRKPSPIFASASAASAASEPAARCARRWRFARPRLTLAPFRWGSST